MQINIKNRKNRIDIILKYKQLKKLFNLLSNF